MSSETPSYLPAVEVLDAFNSVMPVELVEPTALILYAKGMLQTGERMRLKVHPGERASSDELLRGLFDAIDLGFVWRYGGAFHLMPAGRATLREFGACASEEAHVVANELATLGAGALWGEVDRCLGT